MDASGSDSFPDPLADPSLPDSLSDCGLRDAARDSLSEAPDPLRFDRTDSLSDPESALRLFRAQALSSDSSPDCCDLWTLPASLPDLFPPSESLSDIMRFLGGGAPPSESLFRAFLNTKTLQWLLSCIDYWISRHFPQCIAPEHSAFWELSQGGVTIRRMQRSLYDW